MTLTVVVWESVPDWAVTATRAVPLLGETEAPVVPQPVPTKATQNSASIAKEARSGFRRRPESSRIPARARATATKSGAAIGRTVPKGLTGANGVQPKWVTLADVVTVSVLVAAPFAGVTVDGLNAHVIPVICGQENETALLKPPLGVTVSMN